MYGRRFGRAGKPGLHAQKSNFKLEIGPRDMFCESISELLLCVIPLVLMLVAVTGTLEMPGLWALPPSLSKWFLQGPYVF